MNTAHFTEQENWAWSSVLALSVLAVLVHPKYSNVLLYWVIIRLVSGNIRRLPNNPNRRILFLFRRSLYVLPLLLPLIELLKAESVFGLDGIWMIVGVAVGVIFLLPRWRNIQIAISDDLIEITPKERLYGYVSYIFLLSSAAVLEEVFFRAFIIDPTTPILSLVISSFLFFVHHKGVPWSESFSKYDFVNQIAFSLVSAFMFILSGSIIPSVIAHLVLNMPHIVQRVRCIEYHYLSKENIV